MLDINNYYEQLVSDHLWKIVENNQQLSQSFLEDVACLTLNSLPACYVRHAVDKGANVTEHDLEVMNEKVSKAITAAIEKVHQHPHDDR